MDKEVSKEQGDNNVSELCAYHGNGFQWSNIGGQEYFTCDLIIQALKNAFTRHKI